MKSPVDSIIEKAYPVIHESHVQAELIDCLSRLANTMEADRSVRDNLHQRAVTMLVTEVTEGRGVALEHLLLRQSDEVSRVGRGILNYLTDVRHLHCHDRDVEWTLFGISVCVFTGSSPLSIAIRLGPDQIGGIRKALVRAGLTEDEESLLFHANLIPCLNLGRLRLVEQMTLLPQVHGNRLPEGLAFPPVPFPGGDCAPYMLLGVSCDRRKLLSTITDVGGYERRLRRAIMPSLESVPGRMCTVGLPRTYSVALRHVVGDFLPQVVRAGLALGGGPITLTVIGLDDVSMDGVGGVVRVVLDGHPMNFKPFVFHVAPADRQFVLQHLRQRFNGLPVTIRLPC